MLSLGLLVAFAAGCSAGTDTAAAAPATADDANLTADKVLLDCNVFEGGGGPDQQATVVKRGNGLVLKELTSSGSMVERALDQAEWDKQEIKLRLEQFDGPDQVNRLYKKDGEWLNESVGGGWATYGSADCFKDTTKSE